MNKQFLKKIGEELRALREKHGYSLEEVGIKIGKSRKSIHAYEKGLVDISISNLKKMLDIYGIDVGKFLDRL